MHSIFSKTVGKNSKIVVEKSNFCMECRGGIAWQVQTNVTLHKTILTVCGFSQRCHLHQGQGKPKSIFSRSTTSKINNFRNQLKVNGGWGFYAGSFICVSVAVMRHYCKSLQVTIHHEGKQNHEVKAGTWTEECGLMACLQAHVHLWFLYFIGPPG